MSNRAQRFYALGGSVTSMYGRKALRESARRLQEAEGSELSAQALSVLEPAIDHFSSQAEEVSSLPTDSPERLFLEGVLGTLQSAKAEMEGTKDGKQLRASLQNLSDHLSTQFRDHPADTPLKQYISTLRDGLLQLKATISDEDEPAPEEGAPEGEPASEGEAPAPEGEEPAPEGDPAAPESEPAPEGEPPPEGTAPRVSAADTQEEFQKALSAI